MLTGSRTDVTLVAVEVGHSHTSKSVILCNNWHIFYATDNIKVPKTCRHDHHRSIIEEGSNRLTVSTTSEPLRAKTS